METLIALATLTFLEIVLGIDNIVFISIAPVHLREPIAPPAETAGEGSAS